MQTDNASHEVDSEAHNFSLCLGRARQAYFTALSDVSPEAFIWQPPQNRQTHCLLSAPMPSHLQNGGCSDVQDTDLWIEIAPWSSAQMNRGR